jgi:predicted RNA binding protein with dsRBD fold (UPF0201 family)
MAESLFDEKQLAEFQQFLRIKALDEKGLNRLQQLLHNGGVVDAGRREVGDYFDRAKAILSEIFPDNSGKKLYAATDWILNRTY